MPPKNTKSSSSALCKNFQNAPTNPTHILSADIPPHLVDFYRVPVENDIIAGVEWIYCLWTLLHRTAPPSYRAFKELDSTARELHTLLTQSRSWDRCTTFKLIIRSHVRTKALHTIYDILECQGYLESTCPGFIDDILQEIVTCNSDSVAFSADLRRRCKIAAPMLEHKMWALQKVLIKQHKVSQLFFIQSCDTPLLTNPSPGFQP
ncbi:uncharacterized protein EV420DRAFT_866556 [Desarmillaria tabescens]|uniref:Uncharacterized protein n=1 Tax=Armillaria tabescens TaxID=1929756 RepID=A0AA39JU27_ARMTA|nr:uncharacterized protein EV420DRAFT_866556 [Desarmillaria tabescens]KAK0447930.1 hypothetical protein EV420DRAFT_866556 [Desarmillaria tabescens]